jgi:hypothetical protein
MAKYLAMLAVILATQGGAGIARAEFIANAFGGNAENATRAAAARAFEGYQSFYGAMSQLERRSPGSAREALQKALGQFQESQGGYRSAADVLEKAPFNVSRLEGNQSALLFQFLGPFGAGPGSDQSAVLKAYADSFNQTITLVRGGLQEMSLVKFREIQAHINRQILVGTFISRALGW